MFIEPNRTKQFIWRLCRISVNMTQKFNARYVVGYVV
jgi:hypothetical protein